MMVVERAGPDDMGGVVDLASRDLHVDPNDMVGALEQSCCMVCRDVGSARIVGFALARREEACQGHLLALAVDSLHRGEGIGHALLGGIEAELRRTGAMRVQLEVRAGNDRAQAFYERHGYRPEGLESHAYADGEDAVRLARPI